MGYAQWNFLEISSASWMILSVVLYVFGNYNAIQISVFLVSFFVNYATFLLARANIEGGIEENEQDIDTGEK